MRSRESGAAVLIVAPVPPPYGGMALQARLLARMLREDGVPTEHLGYNQPFAWPFRALDRVPGVRTFLRAATFAIRFWLRSRRCTVVHILACSWLYFFTIVAPAIVIGRFRGKRVVLNYRGGDADVFFERQGPRVRPFFRAANVITAPSAFLTTVIRNRLALPAEIVPNIVNFSIFRFRQRRPFRPHLLVTRHLEKLYGVEFVLRAFRQVQAWHPEASLRIAGTGSEETHLRRLVSESGLNNVEFLGYLDHQRLPEVYDQCDILVNASRVDNFPGSLMEASASGLVVVSTKAGGIPYVYEHEKNALLVDIDDWQALAESVERVLLDQSLARDLAAAGREVCRQCEWNHVRRALYEAYAMPVPETISQPSSGQLIWEAGCGEKQGI